MKAKRKLFEQVVNTLFFMYIQCMKRIYLDYASLTPIDKKVMREIKKYSTGDYSNPSALYASAVKAKNVLETWCPISTELFA